MRYFFLFAVAFLTNACKTKQSVKLLMPEGGYSYIKLQEDEDSSFYKYPLKDSLSTFDSIRVAYYEAYFYRSFNEPNISLAPKKESSFRLVYSDGALSSIKPIIITLTETSIIIKKGQKGNPGAYPDTSKLSSLEKKHFALLEDYIYFKGKTTNIRKTKYLDSIASLNPQLYNITYYIKLLEKCTVLSKEPFTYLTVTKSISSKTYRHLVELINTSGYWTISKKDECWGVVADGASFSLEANFPSKYNIVEKSICNDSSLFKKACQELVNEAGLGSEIKLFDKSYGETEKAS